MRPVVLAALVLLALSAHAVAAPQIEAIVARDVVDRQPTEGGEVFPADVGHLVCWTRVSGAEPGSRIEHVWIHEDREVGRVELEIGGPGWRTWSRKSIPAGWTGSWRVDVVGPDSEILTSVPFRVE